MKKISILVALCFSLSCMADATSGTAPANPGAGSTSATSPGSAPMNTQSAPLNRIEPPADPVAPPTPDVTERSIVNKPGNTGGTKTSRAKRRGATRSTGSVHPNQVTPNADPIPSSEPNIFKNLNNNGETP